MPDDIMLSISVNHGDPRIICGGTIYGMFRTTDAGENWQQTGTPRFVMSVDFSSADPAKGFAYGYDTASVCFYTTDAGVNWTPTAAIAPSARLGGILADPGLGDGAWCPTVAGMQYTTDRGAQWTLRSSGIRTATISTISVPPWNPGRVYVEVSGAGVYRSNDAGATWQKCADFLSCGNICGIGLGQGPGEGAIWALEGSG
jgi:photosystem II stability/assembly factor-like uncharacterized protein